MMRKFASIFIGFGDDIHGKRERLYRSGGEFSARRGQVAGEERGEKIGIL